MWLRRTTLKEKAEPMRKLRRKLTKSDVQPRKPPAAQRIRRQTRSKKTEGTAF